MATVATRNLTRRPAPRFAYTTIATEVLPDWDISLVFLGPTQAQKLNQRLRNKDYVPNVLSYAVGKTSGEILICLAEAAKQAPLHDMDARTFVLYLFIHGLLHLKGMPHGATMERSEQALVARFSATRRTRTSLHGTTHRNRH